MSQDNLTADFPQNDKYLQIIEASRWLKREIQKLEKWLDGKEIVFEKSLHEQKNQQIAQDEEMVNYKFDSFKNLLLCYNKCLSKIKEQLQPFCQIRSSFIDRILYSYECLLESIKSYHCNEMNKYILKISMLQTKNQQFEKLFEEIKKRDENRNKFTDVYEMKKKLDIMENEIGISKLFIDDKHNSIEKLLHKDGVGSDTENETKDEYQDVQFHLQEMLAQIYSLKGAANLLKTSNSEKSSFKLDDWEKDIISKLKTTHFGAAKTMMGIIFNKEKFRNIEIQTEDDGLREQLDQALEDLENLQKKLDYQTASLDHFQK